jgi:hypothetical protein
LGLKIFEMQNFSLVFKQTHLAMPRQQGTKMHQFLEAQTPLQRYLVRLLREQGTTES